jgi:hypothetical protein
LSVIVVGGSNKGVGKTSLVCGIIAALPELRWTAIKITSHDYGQSKPIWTQPSIAAGTQEGKGTDTARFLKAGAQQALLVTVLDEQAPIGNIEDVLAPGDNVNIESNSILKQLQPQVCLAVVSAKEPSIKLSFVPLLKAADALVTTSREDFGLPIPATELPLFRLQSYEQLSAEMINWLRKRLAPAGRD